MKRSIKSAVLAGVAAVLLSGTMNAFAQRGGNFDPAQARERQLTTIRERLEVASDDEWKIIQPRVEKILDARTALTPLNPSPNQFGRGGGGGGRGRGGQGGAGAAGGANGGGGRGGFNQTPNPTVEALTRAIESNASSDELKQKLAKWRDERKAKEADLTKAQGELQKVLSVKQEAVAMTIGLVQ